MSTRTYLITLAVVVAAPLAGAALVIAWPCPATALLATTLVTAAAITGARTVWALRAK